MRDTGSPRIDAENDFLRVRRHQTLSRLANWVRHDSHAIRETLAFGDVIDAATALDWGLVNRVVPDAELDTAVDDLLGRATRGSRASKAWGKQAMYAQLDRPERDAYTTAIEVMTAASQLPGAVEGMASFLEKRRPVWSD